ncbi:MAG: sulfurtransferase [Nitrospinales bacterium]
MKPDSTSATLILSRKIRGVFWPVLGLVLMGLIPNHYSQTEANTKLLITPKTLKNIPLDQRIIIDTRSKLKFLMGHIPGAVNLNSWREFTSKKNGIKGLLIEDKTFISNRLAKAGINPKKSIIIYSNPDNPWRTDGRFFWMFERYGFTNVAILDGGFGAWKESGGTIEIGFQKEEKLSTINQNEINLNSEVIADKYLINKVLSNKNYVLIDNRTQKEYHGAIPYGSPRGGHIPNAIHIHWPDFFNKDGTLKSTADLSHLIQKAGIQIDQEIIVYCTGGVRSAMAYFVFRYLGFKVRNYDGSWWDWSHDPNLPLETSG